MGAAGLQIPPRSVTEYIFRRASGAPGSSVGLLRANLYETTQAVQLVQLNHVVFRPFQIRR